MFKFLGGLRQSHKELWEALEYLSLSRTPIQVEIENSLERFTSQLVIREGEVLIARPTRPSLDLTAGSHIRVLLPGPERRELRLQVRVSRQHLGQGSLAFVCKLSRRQIPTRRIHDRYSVRRYRNLHLVINGERFRIVDICVAGCKVILSGAQNRQLLAAGEEIRGADVTIGVRVTIHLEWAVPRSRSGRMVGCEFEVRPDGLSSRYMTRLIASLDKKEKDRRAS